MPLKDAVPPLARPPRRNHGVVNQTVSLARYLTQTEVHTYAFSVAANAILSLFPFIVLMFTLARRVFHSQAMEDVIGDMLRYFLPSNQDFVVRNMSRLANPRGGVQVLSLVMLLISSPLRVRYSDLSSSGRPITSSICFLSEAFCGFQPHF